jgi:5-methylcytosine-specific restriction endonuclease McrA
MHAWNAIPAAAVCRSCLAWDAVVRAVISSPADGLPPLTGAPVLYYNGVGQSNKRQRQGIGLNLLLAKRPMESDVGTQRSVHSIDGIKVLVLNHTYEPLHFCNAKRALIMVLQGKAENVEMSDRVIHSPSRALPLPAVIRLLRYIRRSYRKSLAFSKKNVFRRDNYTCQYCGWIGSDLTIDHIIPRSLGGKTSWDNVVVACQACNVRKGNRRLSETDMHLLRKVKPPPFVVFLNFPPPSAQAFLKIWQNYLPDDRDPPA